MSKKIKQSSKRGRRKFHKVCQGCGGRAVYTYCDPCYEDRKTLNARKPQEKESRANELGI